MTLNNKNWGKNSSSIEEIINDLLKKQKKYMLDHYDAIKQLDMRLEKLRKTNE